MNFGEWRRSILKRDKYACVNCGAYDALTVDHIQPRRSCPELALETDNGRTLCTHCHAKIGKKAGRAPYYNNGSLFVSGLRSRVFWGEDLRKQGYIGYLPIADAHSSLVIIKPNTSTKDILKGLRLLVKKLRFKLDLENRGHKDIGHIF